MGDVVNIHEGRRRLLERRKKILVSDLELSLKGAISDMDGVETRRLTDELAALGYDKPPLYVGQALAYVNEGEKGKAVDAIEHVLSDCPTNREATLVKAAMMHSDMYSGRQSREEAYDFVRIAFHSHDSDQELVEQLLILAVETFNDKDLAKEFLLQGLTIYPERFRCYEEEIDMLDEKPTLYPV